MEDSVGDSCGGTENRRKDMKMLGRSIKPPHGVDAGDGHDCGDGIALGRKIDDLIGNFTQDELYQRIFHKKPKDVNRNMSWGRVFLRNHFPLQWKTYNQNLKMVRSWFSDAEKDYVSTNLRNEKESVDAVKEFIRAREPCLAALLFVSHGAVLHLRWKVEDIYAWFKSYKHYFSRKMSKSNVKNLLLETVPVRDEEKETTLVVVSNSPKCLSPEDLFNAFEDSTGEELNVVLTHGPVNKDEYEEVQDLQGSTKRRRLPSSKAVEAVFDSVTKKKKHKSSKRKNVEDRLKSFLTDFGSNVYQGLQLNKLTENSKKAVAMVVMGVDKFYDVLPNLSCFVSETFPEFAIKLKKDDPEQSGMQDLFLDVVVTWALKEFKVGITNPPLP